MTVYYVHGEGDRWEYENLNHVSYIHEGAVLKVCWYEPGLLMLCSQNANPPEDFLADVRHLWRIGQ